MLNRKNKILTGPADCVKLVYQYTPPCPKNEEHRTDFIIIDKKHKSPYICSMTLKKGQEFNILAFQMYILKMLKKDNASGVVIAEYGDPQEKGIRKDTQELIKALMPIITALDVEIVDYIIYNGDDFYSDAAEHQRAKKK